MKKTKYARWISLFAVGALALTMSPSVAATTAKAGANCAKVNIITKVGASILKCTKANNKLVWRVTTPAAGAQCAKVNITAKVGKIVLKCALVKGKLVWTKSPAVSASSAAQAAWLKDCNNTVTFVVGYSPGGATDIWARLLAHALETETHAKFPVVNDPGAGGSIAISKVSASKKDGCTIGNINLPSGLQYLFPNSPVIYNKESMSLVAGVGFSANALIVNANSPWKTIGDLVAAAKASPGKINGGTDGPGSDDAIAYINLENIAGIKVNQVVTNGSADKVNALLNNQLDFFGGSITGVIPQLNNKQFRLLCVYSDTPSIFTTAPTCKSAGFAVLSTNNWSVMTPPGVPEARRQAMEDLILKVGAKADYQAAAKKVGLETHLLTSTELSAEWNRQALIYKAAIATMK